MPSTFTFSIWFAANYYIDVFSRSYTLKFRAPTLEDSKLTAEEKIKLYNKNTYNDDDSTGSRTKKRTKSPKNKEN